MDGKIQKIVIISAYPFSQRDFQRFGVELIRNNGFAVEIWDISSWLLKNDAEPENKELFLCEGLQKYSKKKDIIQAIARLDKYCMINCIIEYSTRTFFIFREISKRHIPYCVFGMASFPSPYPSGSGRTDLVESAIKRAGSLKISEIYHHIANRMLLKYYRAFGIAPASVILRAGEMSAGIGAYPVDSSTLQLWAHMLDYDIFLKNPEPAGTETGKNGIFLDDYLPLHPDHHYLNIDFALSPDTYYQKVCNFFTLAETQLDTHIIVAAHPRSDYENLPDYFQGRHIVKNQTALLVKDSAFVIAHMSTAINFAILYNKPVIFITTDELEKLTSGKNLTGRYIRAIAAELGKEPINIDHISEVDWEKELKIDPEAYRRYKNRYIKKQGTPEQPLWQIFCDQIKQMTIT